MLQFERVVATGTAALDSGIGETALKTFNGNTYLYSVTGRNGGFASWRLTDNASPELKDQHYFDVPITQQIGGTGGVVTLGASHQLVLDVNTATGLVGYDLNSNGTIGALQETGTLTGGGEFSAIAELSADGKDLLILSHDKTAQIGTYRVNPDGSLTAESAIAGRADVLKSIQVGPNHIVVSADTVSSEIKSYVVNSASGTLTAYDGNTSLETLGINAPTAMEVVQAFGKSWVVVAGSGSNSLSVMRLDSNGQLTPTDHALDTLHTRFAAVQDLAVVEVSGHVFVVAGGGDDGITLFSLTPDGQLIFRDSFADTLSSSLQNVETISAVHIGGSLQIFAASQQEAGLTQLSVSVDSLGTVESGHGTLTGTTLDDTLKGGVFPSVLNGGAGDDILITGPGSATLTGGAGRDIFVIRQNGGPVTITDFQTGIDKLDLSNFAFLRSPAQLEFTSTAQGAAIRYRGDQIDLISETGGPLTSQQVFGAGFGGADHIPIFVSNGPGASAAPGVVGSITIDSQSENVGLLGAELQFKPDGGNTVVAQANERGEFDLDVPGGSLTGRLEIVKSYATGSSEITALDALQILRMAVGLDPTWGRAAPENLIAADITRDGMINAFDALSVLQVAVGLPAAHDAEWIFLDADADLSGITRNDVSYETGLDITVDDGEFSAEMTSILLGNIELI